MKRYPWLPPRRLLVWLLLSLPGVLCLAVPGIMKADLFVADDSTNSIVRFSYTGALVGTFVAAGSGGLQYPVNPILGPDGNLYVPDWYGSAVRRYNGSTGAFIDSFVQPGSGGLSEPDCAAFGPDGNLYVADYAAHVVRRYDGKTGASMGVFTSGGSLVNLESLVFGPDGSLYVADEVNVIKYNGTTGAFIAYFVAGTSGLLAFGSDGNLYVDTAHNGVIRYNGTTGALISQFVPSNGIRSDAGFAFGPDGNLYVGYASNLVLRYSGQTGAAIDTFISSGIGMINGFAFSPLGPQVTEVLPDQGGNAGTVTVQILGGDLQAGAQVKLTGLGPDIAGTVITTATTAVATVRFNLQGAAVGARNVVVTNPDNTSVTLPEAFMIVQGGTPQLSASIVGFNAIWIGRAQAFLISYRNSGNVDALGTHLIVTFPTSVASSLGFGNEAGVVSTGTLGTNTVVTVDLGRVPARSNSLLTMFLTANSTQQPFTIRTSIRGH